MPSKHSQVPKTLEPRLSLPASSRSKALYNWRAHLQIQWDAEKEKLLLKFLLEPGRQHKKLQGPKFDPTTTQSSKQHVLVVSISAGTQYFHNSRSGYSRIGRNGPWGSLTTSGEVSLPVFQKRILHSNTRSSEFQQ